MTDTSEILVADIGGTKSRLAVAAPGGRPHSIERFDNDALPGIEAVIERYLAQTGVTPRIAVLSIAALIEGRQFALTNRADWRVDLDAIGTRFGFARVEALNDFQAVALSLPRLGGDDLVTLGAKLPAGTGPKFVLGPGTGLGTATLVPAGKDWQVVPGEGGHATLGPRGKEEFPVFERLVAAHGPLSVETILSGRGVVRLSHALGDTAHETPEAVVEAAKAGDPAASATMRLFVRLMGRVAGDIALIVRAGGGVYVGGGLGRGIGTLFAQPSFREGFEDHPPYGDWLARVPTQLVTYRDPGLLGCVVAAEKMLAS